MKKINSPAMLPSLRPGRIVLPMAVLVTIFMSLQGCSTVKPYQKAWLNDANMKLGKLDIDKFDESIHTYREGASGGGNGKSSGGCGCN